MLDGSPWIPVFMGNSILLRAREPNLNTNNNIPTWWGDQPHSASGAAAFALSTAAPHQPSPPCRPRLAFHINAHIGRRLARPHIGVASIMVCGMATGWVMRLGTAHPLGCY